MLSFILSRLIFQSVLFALPFCTLIALLLSVFSSNGCWSIIIVSSSCITLFLLENTFRTDDAAAVSTPFIIYTAIFAAAAALFTNHLYRHIKQQRDFYKEQSIREQSLSQLSTALLTINSADDLYDFTVRSIFNVTECSAVLFTCDRNGNIDRVTSYPKGLLLFPCEDVVAACMEYNCRTGFGTAYFGSNPVVCLPVSANGKLLAAVGILPNCDGHTPSEYQFQTAELLLVRAGVVLDKIAILKHEQEILMEKELEHIRSDFLRSISHDLRTPLTGIIGACSMLDESSGITLSKSSRHELIESINTEAEWMMRTVENLLSVTRVGSSSPQLNKSPEPIEEILSAVLSKAARRFPQVEIRVSQPDEFIMIPVDPVLIVQVLMNLIENAVKYSGSASGIELSAQEKGEYVAFIVRDHGGGIKKENINTLFEPSACRSGDSTHGMGLGLSICKSIIVAHGGIIEGHNAKDGGAVFTVLLPKEENDERE